MKQRQYREHDNFVDKYICNKCKIRGHLKRDCPYKDYKFGEIPTLPDMQEMLCYNCNEYGHMQRECPLVSQKRQKSKSMGILSMALLHLVVLVVFLYLP